MNKKRKIGCVIVLFNPETEQVFKNISSLYKQVDKLIIVDNSLNENINVMNFISDKINVCYFPQYRNLGIAKAQNIGMEILISENYDFVVISDQDTIFPSSYSQSMLNTFDYATDNKKIAAIGPDFLEENRSSRQGFEIFNFIFRKRIYPTSGVFEVSQIIASGIFIPIINLKSIGLMKEDLFIDWVDLEWCWRATYKGYKILGNANIVISHTLGDFSQDFMFKKITLHSPLRHYYIIRNAIYLALRSPFLKFGMRLNILQKSLFQIVLFTVVGKPHLEHLKKNIIGLFHGFKGRLGEF